MYRSGSSAPVMAIFHLSVKAIGRAQGRSATAAAAYRAATRIEDERTGLVHDYSRKGGVLHREIVTPEDAPSWAQDRARLWNAAELAENRKNSTVAREFEVALPGELRRDEQRRLACALAQEITARHKCAVDVAIHAPSRRGDERNHHAHLLLTTRRLTADGFTEKTRELDDLKSGEVVRWRERWATLVNEHLAQRGHEARVDHRSLKTQGAEREPTYHKGPAVTAIERRAERSFVAERTQEEVTERLWVAAELGRIERESRTLDRAIIDTTTRLQTALAQRDATPAQPLDVTRREAQTAWLATRAAAPGLSERPPQRETVLDLTCDLAAARQAAREQWFAQRQHATETRPTAPGKGQGAEREPSRLILPDADLAK